MRLIFIFLIAILVNFSTVSKSLAFEVEKGVSYIVVDAKTGEILKEKNAYSYKYPASLTKMMTVYMLFLELKYGSLTLDTDLPVSKYAASKPASKLYVQPGNSISVEDAIKAVIVKSANDVAVVIAEALAGSEEKFALQMTKEARKIGMVRTQFKNASGLHDPHQVSTTFDMYKLGLVLQDQFPEYYHYFNLEHFDAFGKRYYGHNKLVKRKTIDGIKTGYTRASGYNIVTDVKHNNRHLIVATMGSKSSKSRYKLVSNLIKDNLEFASNAKKYNKGLYDLNPVTIFGETNEKGILIPPRNPFRFPEENQLEPQNSPDFSFFSQSSDKNSSALIILE